MADKLELLDKTNPLQKRYDAFVMWQSSKNHAVIEFMAHELGLTVSEVDVFNELGDLDEDEFTLIDQIGFDIGHLFIVVRAPKDVRRIMYARHEEILGSEQPLSALKAIVDDNSDYTSIEELVKQVSGDCWKSISSYLRQRNIESGTINKNIRSLLIQVGNKFNKAEEISEKQLDWLVRAVEHDYAKSLGVFTNEAIEKNHPDDYKIFIQIHEHIVKYATN